MSKVSVWLFVALSLAAAGVVTTLWWQQRAPTKTASPETIVEEVVSPLVLESKKLAPPIQHPVDTRASQASQALPRLGNAEDYVVAALGDLLGRKAVLTFLQTEGFVRRVVATVDNLGRPQSAVRLWPVNATSGRFTVTRTDDANVVSNSNGMRYTAFVVFIESINTGKAVALYKRLYPLFQQGYEELGYPRVYFNDRLVEVIDNLLATPEVVGPLVVKRTEVKGPIRPLRPWVQWEFADPSLNALSAGQKILLRVGPVNERRLKAKLAEIRHHVSVAVPVQ